MKTTYFLTPLLLLVCLTVLPITAEAVTFTVNSTVDAVDAAPGNGVCATVGGVCSLRAAIQEANALPGPDVIRLKAGLYMLTIAGRLENSGATGDLDITDDLSIIGANAKKAIVNGGKVDRVFHLMGAVSVTMADVTVQNGLATDDGSVDVTVANGGGILCEAGSTLTLKGITLCYNAAAGSTSSKGGGISNSGMLTITKSKLSRTIVFENAAQGGQAEGGGIHTSGTAKISAATVSNNIATTGASSGFGGGIMNDHGTLEVRQCTVSNNTVLVQGDYGEGGGIDSNGPSTIIQSTISNNTAQGVRGDGGGIANGGDLAINKSTISGNVARGLFGAGGGMATYWGNVVITGSTLSNNAASGVSGAPGRGGGIFVGDYTAVTVQGASKIIGNFASDAGGGICYGGAGTGTVTANSTLAKNIPDNLYPQP